ncbi:MAG TPA: hypothetical protein PLA12_00045 [Candidatus Hydrogenedens sp.]|nr:hypothetical protein [Candidatus Hydrogenedens sp.]
MNGGIQKENTDKYVCATLIPTMSHKSHSYHLSHVSHQSHKKPESGTLQLWVRTRTEGKHRQECLCYIRGVVIISHSYYAHEWIRINR